jgi:bifunctional non-homologous end joining protein LigD
LTPVRPISTANCAASAPTANIVQLASDSGKAATLVFFLFDLLYLEGEDLRPRPLIERKERLRTLLANAAPCLHYSDHVIGQAPAFYDKACAMRFRP